MIDVIRQILSGINDPEMPISIVDLGIVDDIAIDAGVVAIRILPTFVGCPALDMLRDEIVAKVSLVSGVKSVGLRFVFDPPWTPDRISPTGREHLRGFGVTVPHRHKAAANVVQLGIPEKPCCPFCGEDRTTLTSPFGPTRCRMIYYCDACKNQFEHMKPLAAPLR